MMPTIRIRQLVWHPHITPVEIDEATPEQLEAMKVTPSAKKVSPYVRTLAHDPESYVARTVLFNAIMYAEGGLPRPERELGALGASVVNGCKYCAMIHGRQHAKLTGSDDVVTALWYGRVDLLSVRDRAIWEFAVALSRTPSQATADHVAALRETGMGDAEIVDLIHAVSIFGWANRLMHILGHAVLPEKA
ncbi:peroxidase-related enzyme [Chelativorans sp. AA-79]|uniref:peroxidase-related enzyme n=1 Tax=Chelativorans sp. AA-79 TaxID=3028735 RepID=UPI0023F947AF|nr:peroxidase-related enzyme [Chelativorans sp. AA-79]WEX08010.1 peroxidase-related enzyme [Chelativorans sp. AA-79]